MKRVLNSLAVSIILATSALAVEQPKEQPKTDTTKKAVEVTILKNTAATKPAVETPWTTNKSGLKWRDIVVGKGTAAKMNMPVNCHYSVWLSGKDGKKGKLIQSSKGSQPFKCTLGSGLIVGWSEGMVGMKEGGTRELLVSPDLGWGERAMGEIPPNSTVYFEIEFLNEVKK